MEVRERLQGPLQNDQALDEEELREHPEPELLRRHALEGEAGPLDRLRGTTGGEQASGLLDRIVRDGLPILQPAEDLHGVADVDQRLLKLAEVGAERGMDGEEPALQARISRAPGEVLPRLFDRRGRAREVRREPPAVGGPRQGPPAEIVLQGPRMAGLGKEVHDRPGGSEHALPEEGVRAAGGDRILQDRLEHREALQGDRRADLADLLLRAQVPDPPPTSSRPSGSRPSRSPRSRAGSPARRGHPRDGRSGFRPPSPGPGTRPRSPGSGGIAPRAGWRAPSRPRRPFRGGAATGLPG